MWAAMDTLMSNPICFYQMHALAFSVTQSRNQRIEHKMKCAITAVPPMLLNTFHENWSYDWRIKVCEAKVTTGRQKSKCSGSSESSWKSACYCKPRCNLQNSLHLKCKYIYLLHPCFQILFEVISCVWRIFDWCWEKCYSIIIILIILGFF